MSNKQKQIQLIDNFILMHCAAWHDICEQVIRARCDFPLTVIVETNPTDGEPLTSFAFISKSGKRCNIRWLAMTACREIATLDIDAEYWEFDRRLFDYEYAERKVARVLMLKIDLMIDLINKAYHNDDYTNRDGQEFYNKHNEQIDRLKIQAPTDEKQ